MKMAGRDDPFSSSICLESFTDPKLLPCFHTFCLECIRQYIATTQQGEYFFCPVCRSKTKIPQGGPDKFQSNFYITRTKDDHGRKCEQHSDENIRFYCELCKKFICRDCKLCDHEGHKTRHISDVIEEKKSKLLIMASDVKKKLAKAKTTNEKQRHTLQQLLSSVESARVKLKQTMQRQLEKWEEEISDFSKKETIDITVETDKNDQQISSAQILSQDIDKALASFDVVEICDYQKNISQRILSFRETETKDVKELQVLQPISPFPYPLACKTVLRDLQLMKVHHHVLKPKGTLDTWPIRYVCPFLDQAYVVGPKGDILLISINGSIIKSIHTKGIGEVSGGAAYGRESNLLFLKNSESIFTLSLDGNVNQFDYATPGPRICETSMNICKSYDTTEGSDWIGECLVFIHSTCGGWPVITTCFTKSAMVLNRIPIDMYLGFLPPIAKFKSVYCVARVMDIYLINAYGMVVNKYEPPQDRRLEAAMNVCSICFDNRGNIYLADTNNHAIHVLDEGGFFVKLLLTREDGIRNPTAVEVDESDRLWVAHSGNRVLIGQLCYDQ